MRCKKLRLKLSTNLHRWILQAGLDPMLDLARQTYHDVVEEIYELGRVYKDSFELASLKINYTARRGYMRLSHQLKKTSHTLLTRISSANSQRSIRSAGPLSSSRQVSVHSNHFLINKKPKDLSKFLLNFILLSNVWGRKKKKIWLKSAKFFN